MVPIESFLTFYTNLNLQWIWLGRHVITTKPETVHVVSLETCDIDELFKTFVDSSISWTSQCNTSEHSPVTNGDIVVTLSDNPEDTKQIITRAAKVEDAFRARYIFVHYSYVEDEVMETLVSFAWAKDLAEVVVIQLGDSTIYTALPKCEEPRLMQVSTVQWPNLRKMDLSKCTLKIAASVTPPFLTIEGEDEATLTGFYAPFYKYAKSAFKFQAEIVRSQYLNVSHKVIGGEADIFFNPVFLAPNMTVKLTNIFRTGLGWCVPDSCVLGTTSYFLWREFTWTSWTLLAVSFFAVSLAVGLLTTKPSSGFDSPLRILSTLASTTVKLPDGNARGVLAGWLLAMLVLSTAYQTVLHSMMTAPLIVHKIEDEKDLLKSDVQLICPSATHAALLRKGEEDAVYAGLAARSLEMETDTGFTHVWKHQKTHAIYTSHHACNWYYKTMRCLVDERSNPVLIGLFGFTPTSRLIPAFHRIALQAEASGLYSFWLKLSTKALSCSSSQSRDFQPITVALLWPAILIVMGGFSFALFAFLTEIWWYRHKRS